MAANSLPRRKPSRSGKFADPAAPASPVALAIERHKTAGAAIDADPSLDGVPDHLIFEEDEALAELGKAPCADDQEFFEKLRYMIAYHKRAYGKGWVSEASCDIIIAIDTHLGTDGAKGGHNGR